MRRQTVGCRPQFFAVDIGDGDLGTLGEQGLGGARPKPLAPPVISARLGFKVIFLNGSLRLYSGSAIWESSGSGR